jgi:hypothetical protein
VSASPQALPDVRLVPDAARASGRALVISGLFLLALAGLWILTCFPHVGALLHKTWPEQLVLVGWLVWQITAWPWAGLFFLGGAAARLFLLNRWLAGVLRRARPTTPAPSAPSASS